MLGGSGRQRQPVLAGFLRRPVNAAAHAEPRAREIAAEAPEPRPKFNAHDVELPRPHRPRRVDPGVRAPGGHRRGLEVMDVSKYYDSEPPGADYDDHALAEPADDAHGVRRTRRAEHLHHALLHVDRRLERVALQEPRVRPAREHVPRGAAEVRAQRAASKKMAGILLNDTPVIRTTSSSTSRRAPRRSRTTSPRGSHIVWRRSASPSDARDGGRQARVSLPPVSCR